MNEFEGRKVVIKALVGSWNGNLNTPTSDKDFKFFVMPTFEDLFNGTVFATSFESPEMDFDVHDIRKFGELIWKSNINFLTVLFSIEAEFNPALTFLFEDPEKWAQMNIPALGNSLHGMHEEKMKALHKGTGTTQALVDEFGFDTKQACHALRCLFVMEKFFETESVGKAIWFNKGKKRDILLKVKAGGFTEDEFRGLVKEWHSKNWGGDLSKAFADSTPELSRKEELEGRLFEFIKKGVCG